MNKQISRIASQKFSSRVSEIDCSLTTVAVKDAELVGAVFRGGGFDRQRRFWIALAGLKKSDSHFCLRVAWTNSGLAYESIEESVDCPPYPSSGVADLRNERQLIDGSLAALQNELWLGFVPSDLAQEAATDFLASAKGKSLLEGHLVHEKTLKRPRTPAEVEAGIRIATITNAGTWNGLMQIRPLGDEEISIIVEPIVEKAVGIFKNFGQKFLWARLGGT